MHHRFAKGLGVGGDGLGGLALALFIVKTLIVLGGFLLGVLLSRILARSLGWSGDKRLLDLGLGSIGVGCGVLFVIASFYQSTWAPPPQVEFTMPPGFTHNWVILLEDRTGSVQPVWEGVEIPFFGKRTAIDVPPSGVVRVRDLSGLRGPSGDVNVQWSDGPWRGYSGYAGGAAPKSTGATGFRAFRRGKRDREAQEEPPFGNDAAFGAYVAARERGAL
jgi:hypothetical protein